MNAANENEVIRITGVSKSFSDKQVLNDVSMSLVNGENLVVLGRSGTGKTVLIKCVVRLMDADTGSISVLGKEINRLDTSSLRELRKEIGFLFQGGALYDSMTVKENMEFPLKRVRRNMDGKERDERIMDALEQVGLADAVRKMPSELSGGMRKRISLARTIVIEPRIMLYDEPTTGLDRITSGEISDLINDIRERYKTSSMIITHDIDCVRSTADRIVILEEGAVYAEGKPNEFESSRDELIREFFK